MKKQVFVKDIPIGGSARVTVQTMTNTPTADVRATMAQIYMLANEGADLIRVSCPDLDSVNALKYIVEESPVPIIADVHYDHKIALKALEQGVHKLRINPSNMQKEGLKEVARLAKTLHVPIRVGVNQGSSPIKLSPEKLASLCVDTAHLLEDVGTDELVLAVKSSSVEETVKAYRILNTLIDYPLHVGLTESGTEKMGTVKSHVAIGSLLLDGIGDTIRVSLTSSPVREVEEGIKILRAVGLRKNYVEIISCPTCARTVIDVENLAKKIESLTERMEKPLKIAVMGCAVNGIGESKGASFGVCGGKERSIVFKDGEIIKTVENKEILKELYKLAREYNG